MGGAEASTEMGADEFVHGDRAGFDGVPPSRCLRGLLNRKWFCCENSRVGWELGRKSGEPPKGKETDEGHMNISGWHLRIRVRLGATKTFGGKKRLMKKALSGAV